MIQLEKLEKEEKLIYAFRSMVEGSIRGSPWRACIVLSVDINTGYLGVLM